QGVEHRDEAGVDRGCAEPLRQVTVRLATVEDQLQGVSRRVGGKCTSSGIEDATVGHRPQAGGDTAQGGNVYLCRVLLPPVEARSVPGARKVVDRQLNRFAPAFKAEAVPGGMLRHGPQPGAVAVELEVPP